MSKMSIFAAIAVVSDLQIVINMLSKYDKYYTK